MVTMIRGILLLYFLSEVVGQTCNPDWLVFGEKCYGFGEEEVTWGDADVLCRTFGGKLAEVETAAENTFLKNTCSAKQGYYWLGGTDIFHEGVWRWASTGVQINSFTDWAAGRPNDNGGKDCLHMSQDLGYQWNDADCSVKIFFICEANPLEEPIVG